MTQLTKLILAAAFLAVSAFGLTGCADPVSLSEEDVVGTYSLDEGGTVTLERGGIRVDELFVSPLDGLGTDIEFSGTGTWSITGKQYVAFELTEWTRTFASSSPGKIYASSFKMVERDGELQMEIYEATADVYYHLEKD